MLAFPRVVFADGLMESLATGEFLHVELDDQIVQLGGAAAALGIGRHGQVVGDLGESGRESQSGQHPIENESLRLRPFPFRHTYLPYWRPRAGVPVAAGCYRRRGRSPLT